jgi:hypothetical protein
MLLTCFSEAIPLTAQESMGYSLPPSLSFTELDWELESETLEISVLAVGAPGSAKKRRKSQRSQNARAIPMTAIDMTNVRAIQMTAIDMTLHK